jgi:hypothetical protein
MCVTVWLIGAKASRRRFVRKSFSELSASKGFRMNQITREELKSLAAREAAVCVSVYLPLHRTFPQTGEDPPLLAKLLQEAEQVICDRHLLDESATKRMLAPARELIDQEEFWQTSDADGLGVLLAAEDTAAPSFFNYRLPYDVAISVDVGSGFHLTPLVHLLECNIEFHLLALGLKHVRLYACDRRSINAVRLPAGVPDSFDAYVMGTEVGRPIQFRASTAGGIGGDQIGLVHGQISYKDDHKIRVKEFVSHVGKEFQQMLKQSSVPLVLAAVDYLHPVFREACPVEFVAGGVCGSPDELSDQEMHQEAVALVDDWQERRFVDFNGTYASRLAHGHASHQLEVILPAAEKGRVDSLVIGRRLRVWGERDRGGNTVSSHLEKQPGDVDLLDLAVRETLLHGGDVHSVEPRSLIEGAPAAAILRW